MTEDEFWYGVTPRAFFNAVEGFESLRKTDLEVARLQTLYSINVWIDKNKQITDPRSLWTYPWEKKVLSKEAIEKQRERGKKLAEKWQTK